MNGPQYATALGTLPAMVEWISGPPVGFTVQGRRAGSVLAPKSHSDPVAARRSDPYVVTGISLGLPGMDEVFAPDALERILNGENFISELPEEVKQRLLDKNLVRIVKKPDGGAEFVPCDSFDLIPQLAGVGGYFDIAEKYGIDPKIVAAMNAATISHASRLRFSPSRPVAQKSHCMAQPTCELRQTVKQPSFFRGIRTASVRAPSGERNTYFTKRSSGSSTHSTCSRV